MNVSVYMCGIYYVKLMRRYKHLMPTIINKLDYVIEKLKYRGPDDTGIEKVGDVLCVHTLLSIQGVSKQPIVTENGRIMFNGEIYGTSSLTDTLKGNISYEPLPAKYTSDGYFLADFIDNDGLRRLDELDGEFTINYFDISKNHLHVIIDPFHTKPFCMYINDDILMGSSYESCLRRSLKVINVEFDDDKLVHMRPNTHYVYDMNSHKLVSSTDIVRWDFSTRFSNFDRWNIAFDLSVKKRTMTDKGVFLPLSSGYDSGCIACSLISNNIKFDAYTFVGKECRDTLRKRKNIIDKCNNASFKYVNPATDIENKYREYCDRIENYIAYRPNGIAYADIYNAYSCFGIYQIFQEARKGKRIIFLSGHGGDEIFSDYGNQENKSASTLFMDYTGVRSKWPNFDSSYGRNIIQMFERVGGCFGIESRYPFLDKQVVQEFLWLSDELKNKEFKQCIAQYMRIHNFPFLENKKCRVRVITDEDGGHDIFFGVTRDICLNMGIRETFPSRYSVSNKEIYDTYGIEYYPRTEVMNNYVIDDHDTYCVHSYDLIPGRKDNDKMIIDVHLSSIDTPDDYCIILYDDNDTRAFDMSLIKKGEIERKMSYDNFGLKIVMSGDRLTLKYKDAKVLLITIMNDNLFYINKNNGSIKFRSTSTIVRKTDHLSHIVLKKMITSNLFNVPDEYIDTLCYINDRLTNGCDILFISYNDCCNTCSRYMKAIESQGYRTIGMKGVRHIFNYTDEMIIAKSLINGEGARIVSQFPTIIDVKINKDMMYGIIDSVKAIHMHGTQYFIFGGHEYDFKKNNKTVITTLSGSVYRFQRKRANDYFEKRIDYYISQSSDLFDKSLPGSVLIHYAIDTDMIKPDFSRKGDKIIVGHFPSTSMIKGSKTIIDAIHEVSDANPDKISYIGIDNEMEDLNKKSDHRVPWKKQLERYKKCDVYIECCNPGFRLKNKAYPHINQKEKFGEWGNTCLEACASGCIVITNALFEKRYEQQYGRKLGFLVANNKNEIMRKLEQILNSTDDEITKMKIVSRKFAELHSITNTGKRMHDNIYKNIL